MSNTSPPSPSGPHIMPRLRRASHSSHSAAIRCCQNTGASTADPHSRLFSVIIVTRRPGAVSWTISENLIVQPRPRGRGTQADARLRPGRGAFRPGSGTRPPLREKGYPPPPSIIYPSKTHHFEAKPVVSIVNFVPRQDGDSSGPKNGPSE